MARSNIPLYDFTKDDATSISFNVLPLELKKTYDATVPHRHNYYEIFLFETGGGWHDLDFEELPIRSQSLHFVSPGQIHQVRRDLGSKGKVIFFSRDFFHLNLQNKDLIFEIPLFNNYTSRPYLQLDDLTFGEFSRLFRNMEEEYRSDNPFKEDIIRSYLNILLVRCHRLYESQAEEPAQKENSATRTAREFRILVEKHFRTLSSVQDYADRLALTPNHLNDLTKKALGRKASEIIHDRIVLEAKRLLLHSNQSNKEIAHFLSFDDPSYFSRFFKRKTGMQPTEFRNSVRETYGR